MSDQIPSPGEVLGFEGAGALLEQIVGIAKDKLTGVENELAVGALLETDLEHATFLAGVHAGAMATWSALHQRGLLRLPGDQP